MADARFEVDQIEVDRSSHVWLRFSDGYEATFAVGPLRLACPCAQCRGRRELGQPVAAPAAIADIRISDARLVGNWGLGIDWSDGHATGIYAWEVLRRWAEQTEGEPSFERSDLPAPHDVAAQLEVRPEGVDGGFS
ncbi:MAG: DUF971 domain-containing protein [Actinomycetota bacterium]